MYGCYRKNKLLKSFINDAFFTIIIIYLQLEKKTLKDVAVTVKRDKKITDVTNNFE